VAPKSRDIRRLARCQALLRSDDGATRAPLHHASDNRHDFSNINCRTDHAALASAELIARGLTMAHSKSLSGFISVAVGVVELIAGPEKRSLTHRCRGTAVAGYDRAVCRSVLAAGCVEEDACRRLFGPGRILI
jgi:hypothetical protein